MNILVLGHTGFVGRNIVPAIKQQMKPTKLHVVNTKDCDCTKPFCVSTMNTPLYLLHTKYNYIFNLTTWTKAGDFGVKNPALQWEYNTLINANILKYWRQAQPQATMVAFGSSCCYSTISEHKPETRFLYGEPDDSVYWYAMTKRNLLIGLMGYREQYKMKYTFFIPTTLYGPNFQNRDTHFIFDLIRKIVDAKYQNKDSVTLWGDGNQIRGLLYIDDAIDTIINNVNSHTEINLSSTVCQTIIYYANSICKYINYPFNKIKFDKTAFVGDGRKCLATSDRVPTIYRIPFDVGLKKTIDYYKQIKGYK